MQSAAKTQATARAAWLKRCGPSTMDAMSRKERTKPLVWLQDDLTKAEASKKIDELQEKTGRKPPST